MIQLLQLGSMDLKASYPKCSEGNANIVCMVHKMCIVVAAASFQYGDLLWEKGYFRTKIYFHVTLGNS